MMAESSSSRGSAAVARKVYLYEVTMIMNDFFGEEGLSRTIADHLDRFLQLEAIVRIKQATTAEQVLVEMKQHPEASSVCLEGLSRLAEVDWRDLLLEVTNVRSGMETIALVMSMHVHSEAIQESSLRLLQKLCHKHQTMCYHIRLSPMTCRAIVNAATHNPDNEPMQKLFVQIMHDLPVYWDSQSPWKGREEFFSSIMRAGIMPHLLSHLERRVDASDFARLIIRIKASSDRSFVLRELITHACSL